MKFLGVFLALCIGCSSITQAVQEGFLLDYVKPVVIKIISLDNKGVTRKERFRCTPETCCFSERFYGFMENGRCTLDIHRCGMWSDHKKKYWMEISGTEAERFCGRPRLLHELTKLCSCNPDRFPPCQECNPPPTGCSPREGASLPPDCRPR